MPIQLGKPDRPLSPGRRSIFGKTVRGAGWLAAGPKDWMGTQHIGRGAAFIAHLARLLRHGPPQNDRFRTEAEGGFDLRATAFLYGVTPDELAFRLSVRRRQTARIAYSTFALACLFLLAWLWQALASPRTASRIASTIEFLPFCGLFFLVAFYNALLNFQIRTGRATGWLEYLMTKQPFLPR